MIMQWLAGLFWCTGHSLGAAMGSCPPISVIIPTFNYARFLPRTLKSIFDQNISGIEVIVVDDGSTEDIQATLSPFAKKISYIRQSNQGLSSARNMGLAHASGSSILFLDADDILGPNVLSSQLALLTDRTDIDAAVCKTSIFSVEDGDGNPVLTGCWRLFLSELEIHLCHFNIAPPHAFLVRRIALSQVGTFDTSLRACEDHDFWFRYAAAGYRFAANLRANVFYRRHTRSMSAMIANQRRHDAYLHQRIAGVLFKGQSAYAKHHGAPFIACACGCLLTASRLMDVTSGESEALTGLAAQCLERAASVSRGYTSARYFAARLRLCLAEMRLLSEDTRAHLNKLIEFAAPAPELAGATPTMLARAVEERHRELT